MKLAHAGLLFVRSRMVSASQSEQREQNEGVISVLQQHFENKKKSRDEANA